MCCVRLGNTEVLNLALLFHYINKYTLSLNSFRKIPKKYKGMVGVVLQRRLLSFCPKKINLKQPPKKYKGMVGVIWVYRKYFSKTASEFKPRINFSS